MSEFREAFLRARRRLEDGEDPEAGRARGDRRGRGPEEIELAEALWDESDDEDDDEGEAG